eukprot:TRINITY_DN49_c0_g1_i3.p1 TRINITY_DN49_c0_g1~~TRINITY_DN49_c0_g1_i3.p1  ORF type:complete len:363 (+),score=120.38 TRINITY_DN49_c0_g1_i3:60-1148(+)
MGQDKHVFTQDPNGNVMLGEPIKPAAAYPSQTMPNEYYYQPPQAFYTASAPPLPAASAPPPPPPQAASPPPYYYGASAPQAPLGPQQHAHGCVAVGQSEPFVPNTTYQPAVEQTAMLNCGERTTTKVRVLSQATHANFHDNRITRIEGLEAFPNLLRLTVSWNDLQSLEGIREAPFLRWVDCSGNHLVDFTGIGSMQSLEWLNLTQSNITSFHGLETCPNLTWLCLHHNRFNDFSAAHKLSALQFLDVSDNEVRGVFGLERATALREINLSNNPMCEGDVKGNVASVMKLSALPNLFRLNIFDTFYDPEEEQIVAHFRKVAPHVEVITTQERAAQCGHNYKFTGQDVELHGNKKKKTKCVIM